MLKYIPVNEGFQVDAILTSNKKLKIGIIDADLLSSGILNPNLLLMKVSTFCKEHGHYVKLICDYEELYIDGKPAIFDLEYDYIVLIKELESSVFPLFIKLLIKEHLIFYGGKGFFGENCPEYPVEVERCSPDYSLYDNMIRF